MRVYQFLNTPLLWRSASNLVLQEVSSSIEGFDIRPQGLKPTYVAGTIGTAEAVPYPKPIYVTSPNRSPL